MPSLALFQPQAPPLSHHRPNPNNNTKRQVENHAFSLLQSCTTFNQMTQIHAHIIRNSIHQNNFVIAKLVSSCFCSQNPSYAIQVFDQIDDPNPILWNNMIKGFVHVDFHENALIFFSRMLRHGYVPNNFTFPFVLKACSKILALKEGKTLHGHALKLGLSSDVYVQTSLMDLYGSCREILAARQVFDRMSERDVVTWNAIISGYVRCGLVDLARELFVDMPVRNVSSWTTMIGGFVHCGNSREALAFFRQMQAENVKPDKKMIVTILSAIADLGTLEIGKWVHNYVVNNAIEIDAYVATALIDMYSKCGSIQDAREVFDGIILKTVSCYNAMILGFAVHGMGEEAIKVFDDAERRGIGIDDVTMIAILTACSHSGLIDEGSRYFALLKEYYRIEPKMEHYGCMVDLFGRAGRFCEAMELVESIEADSIVLGTLAFACKIHGNGKLGEELAKRMFELDPMNGGFLVLKSNFYAADGRWEEAAGVRRSMKDKGIQKKPGSSWIEVNNVVHEFVAGDHSHPCSGAIYSMLAALSEQ